MKKNSGVSKIRAAGEILLTTTLAGTAATSAMTQSTTTSAIDLKKLFEKSKTFITPQKVTEHPMLAISISAVVGTLAIGYSLYKGRKYLWNKVLGVIKAKTENLENKKDNQQELLNKIQEELNSNIDIFSYCNEKFVLFSKLDGKTRISIPHYYNVDKEEIKNSKNIRLRVEEESSGEFSVKIVNENNLTLAEGPLNEDILLESPKYREYMENHDSVGSIKKKIENYHKNIEECKNLQNELNNKLNISMVKERNGEKWIYIKDKQNNDKVISEFEYKYDIWSGSEELEFGIARNMKTKEFHIDIRPRNNIKDYLMSNRIEGRGEDKVEDEVKEYIKKNKGNI